MNFIETIYENMKTNGALLVEMHGNADGGADAVPTDNATTLERIERGRGTLRARGIKPGDRVVLLAPNSSRWTAADMALLAEGTIVVPMYARQNPVELVEMMHDAGASLVVCANGELEEAVKSNWPEAPTVTFDDFFSGERITDTPAPRTDDDVVTIIYTSGTSGVPKGVMLTVGNVNHMLPVTRDALTRLMGKRDGHDQVFHYLPFCFAGSRIVLWTCMFRNNPIRMSTDLNNLKAEFIAAKPHYFLNVPALLERIKNGVDEKIAGQTRAVSSLYEAGKAAYLRQVAGDSRASDGLVLALARAIIFKKVRNQIGANLECLICGSAPLGEETQRWFEMLGIPVYQVYGLTETTAIVTMDEPRAAKPGRVGHVIDGVETRISDEGELQVRGPNLFKGYWQRDDATAEAFDGQWFRTGDAAEVDESGNWRIIGRTKNILVPTSGHNIAPEPIEQILLEGIRGAEHVVVFGHARPFLTAVVSGNVEAAEVQDKIDELNESLPHYRRIRKFHITDELFTPENGLLTANQKLKRRALEDHFRTTLTGLYQ